MALHNATVNDPVSTALHDLHVPCFVGTNAQRNAYATSALLTADLWYETDTLGTFQWNGTIWQQIFGTGTFPNRLLASFNLLSYYTVCVPGYLTLASGVTFQALSQSVLCLI